MGILSLKLLANQARCEPFVLPLCGCEPSRDTVRAIMNVNVQCIDPRFSHQSNTSLPQNCSYVCEQRMEGTNADS